MIRLLTSYDPVAFGLYRSAGYVVRAREDDVNGGSFLGALFGSRGGDETRDVALMRKILQVPKGKTMPGAPELGDGTGK